MAAVRRRLGVPAVESGHTAAVGGYFAESHACAEDIEELLRDRLLAQSAFASALFAVLMRGASLLRNARLNPLQSALGIRLPRIVQKAQGAMGGSSTPASSSAAGVSRSYAAFRPR
ncbi:MAG: hypothetical protein WAS49_02985 [Candidatus Dechloromonas phosphoritropha]|nr:hypothetical protein [Candidatus Dechloromonas phosphoritropha]